MNEQQRVLLQNALGVIYDGWPPESRDEAIETLVNAITSRGEPSPAPPANPVVSPPAAPAMPEVESPLLERPRMILI